MWGTTGPVHSVTISRNTAAMTKHRLHMLSFLLLLATAGCADTAFIQSRGKFLRGAHNKTQARQAARILCLWEAAEGQGLDGQPSRGFAGQILFFGPGDAAPFPVHGTIRIFEYDNFDPNENSPKPIHAFVFDDGGWNAHRSESTMGESYNVFLPYVKHHAGRAKCALKVEFTAEQYRRPSRKSHCRHGKRAQRLSQPSRATLLVKTRNPRQRCRISSPTGWIPHESTTNNCKA